MSLWRRMRDVPAGDEVLAPGYVEAMTDCTFDLDGEPVYLAAPSFGRLGSVFHESHPVVLAHPELFRKAQVPLGSVYDQLRDHPAAVDHPVPQLATRSVADQLNDLWRGR